MKRRLFNLAAAVSLGMMLAIVALWVRSYYYGMVQWGHIPMREYPDEIPAYRIRLIEGIASLDHFYPILVDGSGVHPLRGVEVFGFAFYRGYLNFAPDEAGRDNAYAWRVEVPLRWLSILMAALPLCWLWITLREHRRAPAGFCSVCGYDLRATPERCPECGTAAGTPAAAGEARRA